MAAGGPRSGERASRFHRDDRLATADPPRDAREAPRIAERFQVQHDDRRVRVGFPVLEQIVARDVGLVADADERRQSDRSLRGELEHRHAERAALRHQRDASGRRVDRRERGVQPDLGIGVQQAHAVGSDHPQPVAAHFVDQPLLQRAPLVAGFREARRDHDQRLDAGRRTVVDDSQDRGARHGDDRQIDAARRVGERSIAGQTFELGGVRVDRVDRAGEPGLDECVQDAAAEAARLARRADYRDALRREQRLQRGHRRQRLPALGRGDRLRRRIERQLDVDAAVVRLRSDLEARLVEDVEHRRVLGQDRRLEAVDAVRSGHRGQPLEENRPQPLALNAIVDRERHFGGAGLERQVRADRDRPQLVLDDARGHQREPSLRIGRVAERVEQRGARLGDREEAPAPRIGRQLVEEAADRLAIRRRRDVDGRARAVAQHRARHHVVGRRRRRGGHGSGHGHAFASAATASGSTNSRSGWRTVSTGHGAVRTTRSATLPIRRCATAPRPRVPRTIRSTACSRA